MKRTHLIVAELRSATNVGVSLYEWRVFLVIKKWPCQSPRFRVLMIDLLTFCYFLIDMFDGVDNYMFIPRTDPKDETIGLRSEDVKTGKL